MINVSACLLWRFEFLDTEIEETQWRNKLHWMGKALGIDNGLGACLD